MATPHSSEHDVAAVSHAGPALKYIILPADPRRVYRDSTATQPDSAYMRCRQLRWARKGANRGADNKRKGTIMRRSIVAIICAVALLFAGFSTASAQPPERQDVLDQGGAEVYATDGARLVRQTNGLAASITMPTPASGEYLYPNGTVPGHPEVFTLWMFVFNYPENCSGTCGPDDTTNPDVEFGAYNVAGQVTAGSSMTLSGRIGVGATAGAPPGVTPHDLSNPAGAEVHLAVTSHGALDPATLPGEFRTPTGNGRCECWWVAVFE